MQENMTAVFECSCISGCTRTEVTAMPMSIVPSPLINSLNPPALILLIANALVMANEGISSNDIIGNQIAQKNESKRRV